MSDAFLTASRVPTADGAPDPYDHEIALVDTTAPETPVEPTRTRTESPSGSWRRIGVARVPTRSSVKTSIARRKYAKYQENKYNKKGPLPDQDDFQQSSASTPSNGASEAVDFADQNPDRRKGRHKKKQHKHEYAIDVLYENQRGSFLFGIPLYSHSSLLNFDPSPWLNRDFKESPVNITNAQVPDPTWEWSWKTWYVDMSYDVDEEGWQYSFSFGKSTAWHGTHPWFHSFVRRRRWLRKRIKRPLPQPGAAKASNLSAAHRLNAEYFTIHPKRDRSRSPDSALPASYMSVLPASDLEEPPTDITDIATLLKSLRLANIDRAKIDLVKRFTTSAPSDELSYLGPHIPDIMSHLVFQNSRRQLLEYLKLTVEEAQRKHNEENTRARTSNASPSEESARLETLQSAIDSADAQIVGLEYWSDRKHVLQTADPEHETTQAIASIFDAPVPAPKPETDVAGDIRGISGEAEVGRDRTRDVVEAAAGRGRKGKGKQKEIDDREERASDVSDKHANGAQVDRDGDESKDKKSPSPPRLKPDQVLIPDDD
jgi:hypothetical protein